MQTIYLVKAGRYEDVSNLLSFHSKEHAEEFAADFNSIAEHAGKDQAWIEEDTLNSDIPDAREFFSGWELSRAFDNASDYADGGMVDYLGSAL